MTDSLVFAKELYTEYEKKYGHKMDEMKMHKLMYLTQRESLMLHNTPAFSEDFYGWKYGPVLKSVRSSYKQSPDDPFFNVEGTLSLSDRKLTEAVLCRYGNSSSWVLSELSHAEYSWKRSRKGLSLNENGDKKLELSAMKVDAAKELSRRKRES